MGTFYNGANCDIYIGKGAGKKLLDDISNAKKSVKIVSPYLSPFLIKQLIYLHKKGTNIQLVTTDNIEDFYGHYEKNINQLIQQHQIKDLGSEIVRNKWIELVKILDYVNIAFVFTIFLLAYFSKEIKFLYGLIPIIVLIVIRKYFQRKINNKQIYSYRYSQLFPFKVFVSPEISNRNNNTFIHSKIYIIDDEIVYMGSLNFTSSGTKENYETRIRTTDNNAVFKIIEEFNNLFYDSGHQEKNIKLWGREIYDEPIN
ncbi:phospholipase D family protein [Flavobacterium sp. MAHUQ-51]|uniref:phospholipase D family protein n=1 Tax=Flavobacterium sp. GCM10022190 TaxID=3252639 RepID=UPI00360C4A43